MFVYCSRMLHNRDKYTYKNQLYSFLFYDIKEKREMTVQTDIHPYSM